MPATITITRPTFTDLDTLDAAAANAVWITGASVPDATAGSLGVIQLAGVLTGTAALPDLAANSVTLGDMAQLATDKLLGRATAGTGNVELIPCTAAGRAMIAAADAAAQRLLLMTAAGVALVTAADAAAQKTLLGVTETKTRVSAQFNKTTDITLANVPGLSVTVAAAGLYCFEAELFCTCDNTGNSAISIGGTATATAITFDSLCYSNAAASALNTRGTALGQNISNSTARTDIHWSIWGTITVNAGGTLTVQFAQRAATGTSSVLVGSSFNVWS